MYQFIAKQIKELVSEQGLDVVATTANVLLNWAVKQYLTLSSVDKRSKDQEEQP